MKRNNSIDFMRGLCCVLVVFVHARFPQPVGTYIVSISRFAVPFYLLVTGYFSYKNSCKETVSYSIAKLLDTIKLTLMAFFIYFISNTIKSYISTTQPFEWLISNLTTGTLFEFLFFNRAAFLSPIMYYLFMLIYVYIIFIILTKTNLLKTGYYMIPFLLLGNIIISEFTALNWCYSGNFLFTGIPFFLLGNFIHYKAEKINATYKQYAILVSIFFLITLLETKIFGEAYCYLGTVGLSITIFCFCINYPNIFEDNFLVGFGRNHSIFIFIMHSVVITLFCIININYSIFYPLIILGTTIVLSYVYTTLKYCLKHLAQ